MVKTQKARCQCLRTCKNKPLPGAAYCAKHTQFCPRKAPLSGYEIPYNPDRFNKTRRIRESHNCFAYAFDHIELPPESECNEQFCTTPFHQPGRKSGYPKWSKVKGKRCSDLVARLFADVPGIRISSFTQKCPKGYRKIKIITDKDNDYHVLRQDAIDGKFSHKPGGTHVTRKDALGHDIADVDLASFDYRHKGSNLNYNYRCPYLCIPVKPYKFKRGGGRQTRKLKRHHA